MIHAHALTLVLARSCLAALADQATRFEATLAYDEVLLDLDAAHGDYTPALERIEATDREALYRRASDAIKSIVEFGVDPLTVELLLADLEQARGLDRP